MALFVARISQISELRWIWMYKCEDWGAPSSPWLACTSQRTVNGSGISDDHLPFFIYLTCCPASGRSQIDIDISLHYLFRLIQGTVSGDEAIKDEET